MNKLKVITLTVGLTAGFLVTSVHADSYDAMATDRYNTISLSHKTIAADAVKAHVEVLKSRGFHPFATNRYNRSFFEVKELAETKKGSEIGNDKGKAFKPFEADRYHM